MFIRLLWLLYSISQTVCCFLRIFAWASGLGRMRKNAWGVTEGILLSEIVRLYAMFSLLKKYCVFCAFGFRNHLSLSIELFMYWILWVWLLSVWCYSHGCVRLLSCSFAINMKVVTLIGRCSSKRVDENESLLKRSSDVLFIFFKVFGCVLQVLIITWRPFRLSSEVD